MDSKLLCLQGKLWLCCFLVLYSMIIALMIASIFTKSWFFTNNKANIKNYEVGDSDVSHFKGKDFRGSLFYCTESCDASYAKLSDEWCDLKEKMLIEYLGDEYHEKYAPMTLEYIYSLISLCSTFQNLEKASKIYTASEAFSILCVIAIIIQLCLFFIKIEIYFLIFIFSTLACVSHLEGFITSMILTKTNFNGWCDEFPFSTGISIELCSGDGPALGLAISVLLPIISISFCLSHLVRSQKSNY